MVNNSRELDVPGSGRDLGYGFTVRRVPPVAKRRLVGPFIFMGVDEPQDSCRSCLYPAHLDNFYSTPQ